MIATEQPYWGDPGHRLAVYNDSYHLTSARVSLVTVVRHTSTQVVVNHRDGHELRYYRNGGHPVGNKSRGNSSSLRQLDDREVQDALAVAALGLLVDKLEKLGRPGPRSTGKPIRTRSQVLAAMRDMRREIALAWDKMGVNRDDLD